MTEGPDDAQQKEIEALLQANADFYQAIETADMDLMAEVWCGADNAESATCVHPGQQAVHGLSQVLRSWAVICARINYLQFFITDVRVRVQDGVGIVTCVENVLSELPGGEPASNGFGGSHYEAINVFTKDTDSAQPGDRPWRLLTHHSAVVFPNGSDALED